MALQRRETVDHLGRRASRAAALLLYFSTTGHVHTRFSTLLRRIAFALGVCTIVPGAAHAQQRAVGGPCELPAEYYYYKISAVDDSPGDWTPARRKAAFEQLERIRQIVRDSPPLNPLPRFRIGAAFNAGLPRHYPNFAPEGDGAPLPSYLVISLFPPKMWEGPCSLVKEASSSAYIAIVANVPGAILEDEKSPLLSDVPDLFYTEPKVVRTVGGYPQYENGTILITRNGRSPLIHVSQERWLRAVIASFRYLVEPSERDVADEEESNRIDVAALADTNDMVMDSVIAGMEQLYESMKSTNPEVAAGLKKNIEKMRAERPRSRANNAKLRALEPKIAEERAQLRGIARVEADSIRTVIRTIESYLASLTPAQRRADAYYGHRIEYGYTDPSPGPDARRVVMLDPNYFDRNAPRTSIQLLTIVSSSQGGSNVYQQTPDDQLAERIVRSLDFSRLAALLMR